MGWDEDDDDEWILQESSLHKWSWITKKHHLKKKLGKNTNIQKEGESCWCGCCPSSSCKSQCKHDNYCNKLFQSGRLKRDQRAEEKAVLWNCWRKETCRSVTLKRNGVMVNPWEHIKHDYSGEIKRCHWQTPKGRLPMEKILH